jgi:predicted RecB family nuclease
MQEKGNIMKKKLESKSIEQLLAEADELIRQIESDATREMKEAHRLQFEIHAQNLIKIKSEVQGEIEKKDTTEEISESSEGMHEAILDIVKAMKNFKSNLL